MRIPITKPDLTKKEYEYGYKALREGEIGVKSPYVYEFEEKLAKYTGFKYALFVNSGWSALLLACRALKEITDIEEITMPTFTMIASGTAAKQAGLNVHFVDVDNRGLMQGYYNDAIMTVDIYGEMSDARSNIIIEDAAEVFGKLPYYGTITCFSFFYNKIITTGNGGAVVTNYKSLYDEMKLLRHHYYDGHSYIHKKDGYNVSQSGVLAAIGTKQLERADEIIEKRKKINDRYVKEIGAWECATPWYQPYICENRKERNSFKKYLDSKGVDTRDFFPPLHKMPPLKKDIDCPNAENLYKRGVLLPLYSSMTKREQSYVIKIVKQYYGS